MLVCGSLSKEAVTPLTQSQVKERPDEVDSEPDYSDPQDLLDHREIIL
jgi:hypothetical protein